MDLCNQKTIRELLSEFGLAPQKKYGQNFLINPDVPERIADAACADGDAILEIGPGIGCLTASLAERAPRVVALEIDSGLLPVLSRTLADFDNVEIINSDVMKTDISALLAERNITAVSVCANLPYYITTPVLMRLLECGVKFGTVTVMVQAEVASRLCAEAGTADYGAISAVIEYYGAARKLFTVTAGNFLPAPKVNSSVIQIEIYKEPKYRPLDERIFFATVKAAFGQRRKTLVNALTAGFSDIPKSALADTVSSLGFASDIRGERLSCADFVRLSDAILSLR